MNHPIWLNHVLIERNRSSKAHAPTHRLKDWNGKKTKPRTAKKWGAAETRLKIALGLLSCRVCPCSHGLFTESKQATSGTDSRKKKKSFQTEQFRTIGTGHCRDLKSPSPLIVRNLNETSWIQVEGHWRREEVSQATFQWPNSPPRGLYLLKGFRNIWLFQFDALWGKREHQRKQKSLSLCYFFG